MRSLARNRAFHFMTLLLALYALVVAFMWWHQRALLYYPDKNIDTPTAYDLPDMEDIRLEVPGAGFVQAWTKAPRGGMPLIVFFQGNGGHLGYRLNLFRSMLDAGFGLVAVSYPGYGKSDGAPTEETIYAAARSAVEYAGAVMQIPLTRTIFYGESLGTGVAVQMGTEYKPAMVALQSPFTSIGARAQEIYFYLPVRLLLTDKFNSLEKIRQVTSPVLVMHGEADEVVPIRMGKALYAEANAPKKSVYFAGIGHIHFPLMELVKALEEFSVEQKLIPALPETQNGKRALSAVPSVPSSK